MELLGSKLAYQGYGVEEFVYLVAQPREAIEIVRLPLAELGAALPGIRDASTLIALMALRDRLAGTAPTG
jgi:hypothetical protein